MNSLRYNAEKPKYSLLDLRTLIPAIKAFAYGATKYARDNWKLPPKEPTEHLDSAMRHIVALLSGKQRDDESNVEHIGHAIANLLMYSYHFSDDLKEARESDKKKQDAKKDFNQPQGIDEEPIAARKS